MELVSSCDVRATAIRAHILPRIREAGSLRVQSGLVREVVLHLGSFRCSHWTPFRDIEPEEAASPAYRHALEKQHGKPDLPYGLSIRQNESELLLMLWDEAEEDVQLVQFHPGLWEAEILAL